MTVQLKGFYEHREAITAIQRDINDVIARHALDSVRTQAEATHRQYPQYDNYWKDCRAVVFKERVEGKSGVMFEPGDVAMVQPRRSQLTQVRYWTAYSVRIDCEAGVPFRSFVFIGEQP